MHVHGKHVWYRATNKIDAVVPGGHKHARHKKVTRSYQKGAVKSPGTQLDTDDDAVYAIKRRRRWNNLTVALTSWYHEFKRL